MDQESYALVSRIIERAQQLQIGFGSTLAMLVDIEIALGNFNLQLEQWLASDDDTFSREFQGIQAHVNRRTAEVDETYQPLFAVSRKRTDARTW